MIDYVELLETAKDNKWEVQYDIHDWTHKRERYSLKMKNKPAPVSITEFEFKFIYNFVQKHQFKNGYEMATGFGISALAYGLAMKDKTYLCTLDAYIEENYNDCLLYEHDIKIFPKSDGYKSTKKLIEYFDLQRTVYPCVGWSPTYVEQSLKYMFDLDKIKLEYIFIDGMHTDNSILQDIEAVYPYINQDHFVLFLHDTHCFNKPLLDDYLINRFGKTYEICPECYLVDGLGYNLGYIYKI